MFERLRRWLAGIYLTQILKSLDRQQKRARKEEENQ